MSTEQVEHVIDRTGWDPGPWDGEPDKLNWTTAAGLPGMIVRNHNGALCGYVAVTKDHPWFEQHYGAGEYSESPEGQVDVHGGLTYSAKCAGSICHIPEPGAPDDVWWFGFDCNHSGDYAPQDARWRKDLSGMRTASLYAPRGGSYRDVPYVRAQVECLAAQLGRSPTSCPAQGEKA